jgi:hypothetical protein
VAIQCTSGVFGAAVCNPDSFQRNPGLIDLMVAQIPNSAADRAALRADIQAVHNDDEQVCTLDLGARSSNDAGTVHEQLARVFGGGLANTWSYNVNTIPGTDQVFARRETVAQAATEGAMKLAPLIDALAKKMNR